VRKRSPSGLKIMKDKTVYELLVIKKDFSEKKVYQDVSFMKWFRDEDQ